MTIDEAYLQKLLRGVNHDVSAALRSSVGFSSLILSEYAHQLDDKAKKWLELNVAQGKQTQNLLSALSQYARLYDVQEEIARCDLGVLAKNAVKSLKALEQFDEQQIDIELTASVRGYQSLWAYYFEQVIGNSIQHADANRIVVSALHQNGRLQVLVEDNGIHLNEKTMADILQPFRKLESRSTVGLGLSFAKRIAELHDGQLKLYRSALGFCVEASLPDSIVWE